MAAGLKVLFVSSEVAPFAKTGGLADVAGSLPKYLQALGHDVRVVMPKYRQVASSGADLKQTGMTVYCNIVERTVSANVLESRLGGSVPIYFIEQDRYFDREGLYGTSVGDYEDNAERFIFFSKAVVALCEEMSWQPDVIHCNDWQTGLIPAYLSILYRDSEFWGRVGTLFTVHNLAYQGQFWHLDLPMTGLPWDVFTPEGLEFYGKINLLKSGIVFSHVINTVSKRYAQEIQSQEMGHGLDGVLRARAADLYGVINGVDYSVWSPDADRLLPVTYSAKNPSGKRKCKEALLRAFNLDVDLDRPLIGMVGRLVAQKGFDILAEVIDEIVGSDVSFVLLGTGDERYESMFKNLHSEFPGRAGVSIAFDNKTAHLIEAGSDIFLMPSRYEPCGLNQLYSLRYGTVPVVRATGGLDDTIEDYDETHGTGTGFKFEPYTGDALLACVRRAMEIYKDKKAWSSIVGRGMAADFSWDRAAKEYEKLYRKALSKMGRGVPV